MSSSGRIRGAQDLDGGPGPEHVVLLAAQVAALADADPTPVPARTAKVIRLPQVPGLDQCPRRWDHERPEIPGTILFSVSHEK